MRSIFSIALIVTLLFGGGYFYYVAQAVCPAPLSYSVGAIDASFGINADDLRLALADAESVWEDATGQNLFTYDPESKFTVNLIYDERQAFTDAEGNFKQKLDQTKNTNEVLTSTYTTLTKNYDQLQKVYTKKVERYETNLNAYNTQVAEYNAQGGVTEELYLTLQERKEELDVEQQKLDALAEELNKLVKQINEIGAMGNAVIETYNKGVQEYNHTFGEPREFTQGAYSSQKRIDIYSFSTPQELRLVLAHELGHALGLNHVANEKSVMYLLIGDQPQEAVLTPEDLNEFNRVCGKKSFWDTIKQTVFNT